MSRKLVGLLGVISLMVSQYAAALGFGEITLNSSLNQPLDAEITILNVGDLSQSEILVTLASKEDFERAGVEREFFLTNLNFKVIIKGGQAIVKVFTRRAVPEPYLNFLVEVQWPSGRLLREYTVLLDLPIFSDEEPMDEVAEPEVEKAAPAPKVVARPAPTTSQPSRQAPTRQASRPSGDTYGPTNSNDTAWELALKLRPDNSVSVQQTMMAIRDMNPDAFIRGNVNLLKRGQTLQIPTLDEINQNSQQQAVRSIAEDNRSFSDKPKPQRAQIDASRRSSETKPETEQYSEGYLKLTAPTDKELSGTGSAAGDTEGGGAGLANDLALAKEELTVSRRENEDIKTRLQGLEEQIETMQKLLQLKDEELAAMQQTAGTAIPAATATDSEAVQEQAVDGAPVDSAAPAVPGVEGTEQPAEVAATEEPVVTEKVEDKKEAPKVISKPEPADEGFNPIYMAFLALIVISMVVGLIFVVRRRSDDTDVTTGFDDSDSVVDAADGMDDIDELANVEGLQDGGFAEEDDFVNPNNADPLSMEGELSPFEENLRDKDSGLGSLNFDDDDDTTAVASPETGDAIGEADIYIAYGRFQQAIDLLSEAIGSDPQSTELRLKLLEVYVETQDQAGFDAQYASLVALGDDAATSAAAECRLGLANAGEFNPATVAAESAGESAVEESEQLPEEDFSLDMNLGLDDELDEPATEEPQAENLDFDIRLDEELETPSEPMDLDSKLAKESSDLGDASEYSNQEFDFEVSNVDMAALDKEVESLFHPDDEEPEAEDVSSFFESEGDLDAAADDLGGTADDLEMDLDLSADDTDLSGASLDDLSEDLGSNAGSEGGLDLDLEQDTLVRGDGGAPAEPESAFEGLGDTALGDGSSFGEPLADIEGANDPAPEPVAEEEALATTDVEGDDFNFLADTDEVATKLDLARAYIDMGDRDGARDILDEVMDEGDDDQCGAARELIERLA